MLRLRPVFVVLHFLFSQFRPKQFFNLSGFYLLAPPFLSLALSRTCFLFPSFAALFLVFALLFRCF